MRHKDHEVADICDVADDAKQQLLKVKRKCSEVVQTWREREDALVESEAALNSAVEKAAEKVETTKQDLCKEIEKVAKEFESKISQKHKEQMQEIERAKSKLAYSKENFEELQELIQEVIDSKNPTEITKNLKQMKHNYEHLCQKDTKRLDVTTKVYSLHFDRAEISNFNQTVFGKLREETVVPEDENKVTTTAAAARPAANLQPHPELRRDVYQFISFPKIGGVEI